MKNGISYSVIACVLAGPTLVTAAETPSANIYGRLHFTLSDVKGEDIALNNAGHRVGIKGEGTIDNGMEFFYKLETQYNNDDEFGRRTTVGPDPTSPSSTSSTDLADVSVRHAHVGLKGSMGKVTVGRQNNPLNATYTADYFEANSGAFEQTPFRISHAVVAHTATYNGLSGYAGIITEGNLSDEDNEDFDGGVIGGAFSMGDFTINAGYFETDFTSVSSDKTEFEDWSVGLSYTMGELYFGANVEQSETTDTSGSTVDVDVVDLALLYNHGKLVCGLGYSTQDPDNGDKAEQILLGAYYNLGGNNDVYVELAEQNSPAGNGDNIVLGYRIKF